ncbi:MAG: flagellar hook-associated protein FlgK [Acidimicrobiia bacterium]
MSSDFGALQLALSALYANRRGLDTVGHNISNANTEGYSRQRVDFVANSGPKVPATFSIWDGGGAGVSVTDVSRTRDVFLEMRSYLEHGTSASMKQTQSALASIEQLFNEPSDNGIQKQLADFWAGWDDVANVPNDAGARSQLLQRAGTIATTFNTASTNLDKLKNEALSTLNADVQTVNSLAAGIAKLNEQIQGANVAGLSHNDLLDQRDLLVSKLSDLLNVSTRQGPNETIDVLVNGTALVSNDKTSPLVLDTTGTNAVIRWQKDGYQASVSSGAMGGRLSTVNDVIPRYLAGLDAIATNLVSTVNGVHAAIGGTIATGSQDLSAAGTLSFGLTLNGTSYGTVSITGADWSGAGGAAALQGALQSAVDAATGSSGAVVVTVTGGNGSALHVALAGAQASDAVRVATVGTNAGVSTLLGDTALGLDGVGGRQFFTGTSALTLAVSTDVVGNANAIGAGRAGAGANDNHVALGLAGTGDIRTGPDQAYRAYIVGLGVEAQNTNQRVSMQDATTRSVDSARQSQAGVNLDEEMINMTSFQQAYSASARYMTAIDEMLDALVNRTGLVGR